MPNCSICGEQIPAGSRACPVCGTSSDEHVALGIAAPQPVSAVMLMPAELPQGARYCPACVRIYGPDYRDSFCGCGTELLHELPAAVVMDEVPMAPVLEDEPTTEIEPPPGTTASRSPGANVRPAPGTPCLVLYGADKLPMRYFALTKDAMLIGRLDALAGNFPDIDLDEWFDRATIRKVSRQHALILRSRATRTFALRPLLGNTGTQIESAMAAPLQDFPLNPGCRIILGGVVRLKFEIA